MYVSQSSDRRSSGTYYTPRVLAEEVVQYALEPIVYSPGPADGVESTDWKLKKSTELLNLKICDMAMGSGAFLVAACRYLSARLLEAWEAAGLHAGDQIELPGGTTLPMPVEENDREVLARRLVADSCIYGVDRNPMAVEMAKLSMWLITLAKDRPFTFVDHALRLGDTLLGITDLRQLDCLHLDPAVGRRLHGGSLFDPAIHIQPLIDAGLEKRRQLESFPVVDVGDAQRKLALLGESTQLLSDLRIIADLVVGAAIPIETEGGTSDNRLLSIETEVCSALDPARSGREREQRFVDLQLKAEYWLDEDRPAMAPDRRCLHWPLEFPEVFCSLGRSGFDAIVGNPPFLSGTDLRPVLGAGVRGHLVEHIANGVRGVRGQADLCVYFVLRAAQLSQNIIGLVGTNSIADGDSQEVGVDQLLKATP
jgi:hypothetical protein